MKILFDLSFEVAGKSSTEETPQNWIYNRMALIQFKRISNGEISKILWNQNKQPKARQFRENCT